MLTVSILRTRLRNFLEEEEITLFGQSITTIGALKALHYSRNELQDDHIGYARLIEARDRNNDWKYELMGEAESAFHQLNRNGDFNNTFNAKWVSNNGLEEFVYKYIGSEFTGQFAMLTTEPDVRDAHNDAWLSVLNAGSFNFAPASNAIFHTMLDIVPWVLWGNDEVDATRWTPQDRLTEMVLAVPEKLESTFNNLVDWTEENLFEVPFGGNSFVRVRGTADDDLLFGTGAAERFRGSSGEDTVDYAAADRGITASLARREGFDGAARGDEYFGIENLTGTRFGDILIGDNNDNVLIGGGGADILSGGHGNDILGGGNGANILRGGTGNDIAYIFNDDTEVRGGRGTDTIISALDRLFIGGHDRFSSVEVFQLSVDPTFAARADTLIGSDKKETLIGNSFDNDLFGNGGKDTLEGGQGNDGLEGGLDNDTYVFRTNWGNDLIRETGGVDKLEFKNHNLEDLRFERDIGVNNGFLRIYDDSTGARVVIVNHFDRDPNEQVETLVAKNGSLSLTGGLPLTGTAGFDSIQGTAFDDTIDAGAGNDNLRGSFGEDTLIGGTGNDVLEGGADDDTYIFRPGFGRDRISEFGRYLDETDSGGDTIEFYGISQASVTRSESSSNTTLIVGDGTDQILILGQTSNNGDGPLVEWVSFDGGLTIPVSSLMEYDG